MLWVIKFSRYHYGFNLLFYIALLGLRELQSCRFCLILSDRFQFVRIKSLQCQQMFFFYGVPRNLVPALIEATPPHQTLNLAQCGQTSTVLLANAKPRTVHQIARWKSFICHSREWFSTAQESSVGVLYTTASFGDVWLECMLGNPFHEALWALTQWTVWRSLTIGFAESWISLHFVTSHFVAELLWLPNTSTFLYYGARPFQDWTCCIGGILVSHWNLLISWEQHIFFHKCL